MGSFSIGGLGTGLDTQAIIDQLVSVDSRPKQKLEWKQQLWTARKAAWTDLNTRLLNLQNAAKPLFAVDTWSAAAQADAGWVDATVAKVKEFVKQYNSALDLVHQKTAVEQRVVNPRTGNDYVQGAMSRDMQYSGVAFDLRRHANDAVAGLPGGASTLRDIGITTAFTIGGGAANGTLQVDEAKLKAALTADPASVQAIFGQVGGAGAAADDGIARRISDLVSQMRTGGSVDAAIQGASSQLKGLQDAIQRANDRLEMRRKGYERMFTSLETRIGTIQSQSGWLGGQFAQMAAQAGF